VNEAGDPGVSLYNAVDGGRRWAGALRTRERET